MKGSIALNNIRRKKLPIGIEMFCKIRTEDYYYVDKTNFIKELLLSHGEVNLFTRPRRFGKSLNMDMLRSFFEPGTDASLFNGLLIQKENQLCDQYMGQFPVIFISFKDCAGNSFAEARDMLESVINEEALRHQWLMDSPKLTQYDKKQLDRLLEGNFEKKSYLTGSLRLLCRLLFQHHKKRVICLIDEYDVPLNHAYQKGYYLEMTDMVRSLFSQAFKTNSSLHFAVLTGCLRIARESIFTGLNHFKVRSISDTDFSDSFGFTNQEVKDMLAYYGLSESFEKIKEWYDGYRFGQTDICCPWDVINQCDKLYVNKDAPMEPHWANSSSNAVIQELLENATATTQYEIESLISGESIEKTLMPELTYADLDQEDSPSRQIYLWSLLYSAGYLTAKETSPDGRCRLIIPNKEILKIFEHKIQCWFSQKSKRSAACWKKFCHAFITGSARQVQQILNTFMAESISIRDTFIKKEMKENFYHRMILGLLCAESSWAVKSNAESGIGFTDILLELQKEKTGCVIELKYAENGAYEEACAQAMQQITDNRYAEKLELDGMQTIYLYGIACYKKMCRVVCQKH